MHVFESQVECLRISSIADINTSGERYVELGWFEDTTGLLAVCPATDGSPRVFRYSVFDGTIRCDDATAPLSGGTDQDFWVQDANQNGVWTYFRNGNSIGAYDMGSFVSGRPVANGERRVSGFRKSRPPRTQTDDKQHRVYGVGGHDAECRY